MAQPDINKMVKVKKFHIGIKALIKEDGKILVLKDAGRYSGYDLPGGKVDEKESYEQALKRELNEEIGLKRFKLGKLLYIFEREDYKEKGISLMLIFFEVFADKFDVKLSNEHNDYRWISKKDFKDLDKNNLIRNDGVKKVIEMGL